MVQPVGHRPAMVDRGVPRVPGGDQLLRPSGHLRHRLGLRTRVPSHPNDGSARPVRRTRPPIEDLPFHQRRPRVGLRPEALPLPLALSEGLAGVGGRRSGQHGRSAVGDVPGLGHRLRPLPPLPAPSEGLPSHPQAPPPAALPGQGVPRRRKRAPDRARHRGGLHVGCGPRGRPPGGRPRAGDIPLLQHPRGPGHAEPLPVRRRVRHNTLRLPEVLGGEPRDAPQEVHRELRPVLHVVRPLHEDLRRLRGTEDPGRSRRQAAGRQLVRVGVGLRWRLSNAIFPGTEKPAAAGAERFPPLR
mmetsp:Transcript_3122/g.8460  ORF Transcript_3122/g.8460 Transcript_3122/m.8460 type:complete len:300 (+) Transcript_3122:348-1247(+)